MVGDVEERRKRKGGKWRKLPFPPPLGRKTFGSARGKNGETATERGEEKGRKRKAGLFAETLLSSPLIPSSRPEGRKNWKEDRKGGGGGGGGRPPAVARRRSRSRYKTDGGRGRRESREERKGEKKGKGKGAHRGPFLSFFWRPDVGEKELRQTPRHGVKKRKGRKGKKKEEQVATAHRLARHQGTDGGQGVTGGGGGEKRTSYLFFFRGHGD